MDYKQLLDSITPEIYQRFQKGRSRYFNGTL